MSRRLRLLLVEDSDDDARLILRELRQNGYNPLFERVDSPGAMYAALGRQEWDIVIADYSLPRFSGRAALNLIKQRELDLPIIMISGVAAEEHAVAALREGASAFLDKNNLSRLTPAVERELRGAEERRTFRLAEVAMDEAETKFRATFNQAAVGIAHIAPVGSFLLVNQRLCAMLGYAPEELLRVRFQETTHTLDVAHLTAQLELLLAGAHSSFAMEARTIRKNGTYFWTNLTFSLVRKPSGGPAYAIVIVEDITERKRTEEALRRSEEHFRLLASNSTDLISRHNPEGIILYASPAAEALLGYSPNELTGHSIFEYYHPDDVVSVARNHDILARSAQTITTTYRIRHKDGRYIWFETRSRAIRSPAGEITEVHSSSRDVSQRKEAEQALIYLASHDSLTGLPNRTTFLDRTTEHLARPTAEEPQVALMLLDLDRFKEINDTFGHRYGDLLLGQIGPRLRAVLRAADEVSRLGGDEFALLLPDTTLQEAIPIAETIVEAFREPFPLDGYSLAVDCSIGIAVSPVHGGEATTLLRRADVAMYAAKSAKSGYTVYAPEIDEYSPDRLSLIADLRQTIKTNQLTLAFQPRVGIKSRKVEGLEALARWYHPTRGWVPPGRFVPLAEHTGFARSMNLWILSEALRQRQVWQSTGLDLVVGVNLSARNLHDPDLPDSVAELLRDTAVPPDAVEFEITEGAIMVDPMRVMANLQALRRLGVAIAIDDFGTGYSSLGQLTRLPVDSIKIDRSFISQMATNRDEALIVRTIADLGRNLGLRVVAEGVEDELTWGLLAAMGCDSAQGYFVAPPLTGSEVGQWLEATPWAVKGAKA